MLLLTLLQAKPQSWFCCRIHLLRMYWGCIRTDRNTNQNNILCNSLMEFFSVYVLMCSILKRWYIIPARMSRLCSKKKEVNNNKKEHSSSKIVNSCLSLRFHYHALPKQWQIHNNFKMVGDVYINTQFAHTKRSLSLTHSLTLPLPLFLSLSHLPKEFKVFRLFFRFFVSKSKTQQLFFAEATLK